LKALPATVRPAETASAATAAQKTAFNAARNPVPPLPAAYSPSERRIPGRFYLIFARSERER